MQHAIQTPEQFEAALEEARQRFEGLPTARPFDAEQLDDLLRRIADYHDRHATVQTDRVRDELRSFEDHLQAYGRHWPAREAKPDDHWSPMLGGGARAGRA